MLQITKIKCRKLHIGTYVNVTAVATNGQPSAKCADTGERFQKLFANRRAVTLWHLSCGVIRWPVLTA